MRRASKQIWQLLDTTISAMGYEFVGAEFGQAENGMTLRVYIDLVAEKDSDLTGSETGSVKGTTKKAGSTKKAKKDKGDQRKTVLVDDCADVSRQVGAVLDVEDPIQGEYVLEVSSPGLNRPLFSASQFEAQIGETIKLKLRKPVELEGNHRRNFKGTLVSVGVEAGEIELQADGRSHRLLIDDVEQARLVYAF